MEEQKFIRVKLGFSPKPANFSKAFQPLDVEEGTTLQTFVEKFNVPFKNYPSRQRNNSPIDEKEFGGIVLENDDVLMFSQDISGNFFEQCSQWCHIQYVKYRVNHC